MRERNIARQSLPVSSTISAADCALAKPNEVRRKVWESATLCSWAKPSRFSFRPLPIWMLSASECFWSG